MYFHPKFARLPSTYDVIARDSNWSSLNLSLSQNVRDGLTNSTWKRQVLMFHPLGKNPYGGEGRGGGGEGGGLGILPV